MKALILVGGFGTRLRPLTLSVPKPLVEFCNMPIVEHQIKALVDVGVKTIVLAVNYKPETMMGALKDLEAKYGITLVCSQEMEPMGTAGPLALAREHLDDGSGAPFFVFNSDVTCEYPLAELLAFHRSHGGEGTLLVTKVDEPSKYGVVVHDAAGSIRHFVEKPQTFVGNHINAGLYCLSPAILARIPLKPTSIEKEVFPVVADEGKLFALPLKGYWADIGQPRDYLTGMCAHLASLAKRAPGELASGPNIKGEVMIHPTATVAPGAVLGPHVVVGPHCVVEDGARIKRSTLLAHTRVAAHAFVSSSIVGWHSSVGQWARVTGEAVLGEDVAVADETALVGAIVLPHKGIKDSIYAPGTIIM